MRGEGEERGMGGGGETGDTYGSGGICTVCTVNAVNKDIDEETNTSFQSSHFVILVVVYSKSNSK